MHLLLHKIADYIDADLQQRTQSVEMLHCAISFFEST